MRFSQFLTLFIGLMTLFISCEKLDIKRTIKIETDTVSNVTSTTAEVNGEILDMGEADVVICGHCWSQQSNPTVDLLTKTQYTWDHRGVFPSQLFELSPGTKYYVRAYATDAQGTIYSRQIWFASHVPTKPTVLTTAITSITFTTVSCEGKVISEGDAPVTHRGVCWGTDPNPESAIGQTDDGNGLGPYSSKITGLARNTIYYVHAYATSNLGTSYGNEIRFKTSLNENTGSIMDRRDEKMYGWVKIGSQVWMAENMAYLPSVSPSSVGSATDPYYYVNGYESQDTAIAKTNPNYVIYGVLYNWPAAMKKQATSNTNPSGVQGICPDGWHLPSDVEWIELIDYLGGSVIAGGKLKEGGFIHWTEPNTGADNNIGFTALPGGHRAPGGGFSSVGNGGMWWSATQSDIDGSKARRRYIGFDGAAIIWNDDVKEYGFSVRCILDN